MRPKIVSDIVTGERRSAIGQFVSLSLTTVPEVFAKANSAKFTASCFSLVANHNTVTISLVQKCESN